MPRAIHRANAAQRDAAYPKAGILAAQRELAVKALCIDTGSGLAARVVKYLSSGGYDVELAIETEQGLMRAQQATFDLVIVGIGLDWAVGLHALQNLRSSGVTPPVLALCVDGDPALAFEIGHLPAVAYERAPIDASKLIAAARQAVAYTPAAWSSVLPPSPHCPASERLAKVTVAASRHPSDWRSLEALAAIVGVGYGTLRAWCVAARTSGRAFNRFCRIFRAVNLSSETGVRATDLLDLVELNTVTALFRAGGIEQDETSLEVFCSRQALLSKDSHIAEFALALVRQR